MTCIVSNGALNSTHSSESDDEQESAGLEVGEPVRSDLADNEESVAATELGLLAADNTITVVASTSATLIVSASSDKTV